ncbi:transportin-3-like isoform X2 [Paramuricea clavata]|uniref:Transportin-3-like isoform X2 n=1 Tax=Paramuricea clavata TaxID=317549 RepID=A0A6S7FXC9_PARCT|nr:transportin-3-like isoform X2 [Paramuricea clavata]
MEKPRIEQVLQAIDALYNIQNAEGKEAASKWLENLQTSVFAWEIADQLLTTKQSTTSCFIGAQTMRTKIQYFFHELQPVQYESLKNSLLNHITQLHNSTQAILNQLCLAVADLAVQMPQWSNPVTDLVERFSKTIQMIPALLEILQYLTEEVKSEHLRVGANRREEVANQLRQSSLVVIQLLNACVEQCPNEEQIRIKIFCCLGGWLLLGAYPPDEVMKSRLLPVLFETLVNDKASDNLQEAATDVLCYAIFSVGDLGPQSQMAAALSSEVLKLVPMYEQAKSNSDHDRCLNFCRIFTELAESTLDAVLSSKGLNALDLKIVEMMIKCLQHSEYEVAEVTFNFWYSLSEAIYREDLKQRREGFLPYYQAMFQQLCLTGKLDNDTVAIPKPDDDFNEFRERVVELVKDCVFMLGSDALFSQLCQTVIQEHGKVMWQDVEAKLFIMAAVATNFRACNPEIVTTLFNLVFNKPESPAHIVVKYTAIKLIGELAQWIDKNPKILDLVLQILYQGLQTQDLSCVSAESLQKVCTSCQKRMAHHFTILLQIVQAIDSLSISTGAVLEFFQGVARVLSELPRQQIEEGIKQICLQQVQLLAQLLRGQNGSHSEPIMYLDRIATIFRYTEVKANDGEKHPCFDIVQEVWPVVSMTFRKYQTDVRTMERCCRCVRFIIRCLGTHFVPLLGQLVSEIIQVYSTTHHSCFLYLGSILVDEFGTSKNCVSGLIKMLEAFCPPTFAFLSSPEAFVHHPDTVDDLFRLCTRCVQTCPIEFLKCSAADNLIKYAVAASTLSHREANASVMTFLRDLIHGPSELDPSLDCVTLRNLIGQVLTKHGQEITMGLVQACAGKIPSYMVPSVGEVFWEMLRYNKEQASNWLVKALEMLPTQTVSGTAIVTKQQIMEFHHGVTSADAGKIVCRAARAFSRLYE